MKLGMLINTDRHRDEVIGIARAALARGHEVTLFTMDTGTKLLGDPAFTALCAERGLSMSFCDLNAKGYDVSTVGAASGAGRGSQYDNAVMVNRADRVIVL
jgi:hypothetical protein